MKSVQITIVDRTGKEIFTHDSEEKFIGSVHNKLKIYSIGNPCDLT